MLRRSAWALCAARGGAGYGQQRRAEEDTDDHEEGGPSEEEQHFVKPGGYGMKLEEAYSMFGFKISDKVEKAIVKDRFNKLAKKAHPDLGGSQEAFMRLMEAQKLLLSHSHEPKTTLKNNKTPRKVQFTRQDHSDVFNSVTWENAEDLRVTLPVDYALGILFFFAAAYAYYSWLTTNVTRSADGRSRMVEDEMKLMDEARLKQTNHAWHPWRASAGTRDMCREVEEDRLARRAEQREREASPWSTTAQPA
jgi:hypothetical protein